MTTKSPLALYSGQVQEVLGTDTIRDSRPLVTRTLSWSNGGQGSGLSSYLSVTRTLTSTNFGIRVPFRLPEDASNVHVKIRNYNSFSSANGAASLTIDAASWGVASTPSTGGLLTGNFAGSTANTITGAAGSTIPNTTSYWDSGAISGFTPTGGADYLLAVSFHAASSTTLLVGIGQCWYWSNNTSATTAATASSTATNTAAFVPLDIVIEYTTTSRKYAGIVFGDSIAEGAQGIAYYQNSNTNNLQATPLHLGFMEQWAARRNVMLQRHALFASTATMWASSGYTGYSRMSTTGPWDIAFIELGANDIAGGRTWAQLQPDYQSCIDNIRAIIGSTTPLYALTVMPEAFATGASSKESYRYAINAWLGQKPQGLTGAIDVENSVRGWLTTGGSVATNAMDYALSCDGIHPSYQGSITLADAMMAVPL